MNSLVPSDSFTVSSVEDGVKLRTSSEPPNNYDPITIPQLLNKAASEAGSTPALSVKRNGEYITWTFKDYLKDVRNAAQAMLKMGLNENDGVGILSCNSPEWFIADLGAIYGGGFTVGIYPTSSPDACQYIADNSKCSIIFVEDAMQLQKILEVKSSVSSLKHIVQINGEPSVSEVLSWKEFMALGQEQGLDDKLEVSLSKIAANKCCQIVYTSGTTGRPKGVMLSHDNITFISRVSGDNFGLKNGKERVVTHLPLSHIAAVIVDIFWSITFKSTVYFADKNALKGTLTDTFRDCRPTILLSVPRVYEKIQEKIMNTVKTTIDKTHLGLDKCHTFISAAAPINVSTIEYFQSLDILILELFGMSECCGPHITNTNNARKVGSVGRGIPGLSTKISANGEICLKGRHIMMGYLKNSKATEDTFTKDGWLKTGDFGEIDSDGYLYISGRQKELLITAGGENVPPIPIEAQLKDNLPILSNALVIGDRKKYLSCFFTLKVVLDPNTKEPSDKLSPEALDWCEKQGSKAQEVSEIIDSPDDKVLSAIQEGINKYNSNAVSTAQKIQKWIIIPTDFSIASGELGPTLKLKRHFIMKKYDALVQKMYL